MDNMWSEIVFGYIVGFLTYLALDVAGIGLLKQYRKLEVMSWQKRK